MGALTAERRGQLRREFALVERVLEVTPAIDKSFGISSAEFRRRQATVAAALAEKGLAVGFVFSVEHYDGDVPYLVVDTNVSIEQVAGVIGPEGFHVVARLERG